MERRSAYLAVLMVVLTLASPDPKVKTESAEGGVKITCTDDTGDTWKKGGVDTKLKVLELEYNDDNTGEYVCGTSELESKIYVKFRTCDNCIDLEAGTLAGIIVGEVMATALIGVAVYLLASHPQGKTYRQSNNASDRQNLIPNQQNDTTYQPLSHGHSSEYSHLEPRRARR